MAETKQPQKITIEIRSKETGGLLRYSHDLNTLVIQALSGQTITSLLNLVIPNCSLEISLDNEKLDISEEDFKKEKNNPTNTILKIKDAQKINVKVVSKTDPSAVTWSSFDLESLLIQPLAYRLFHPIISIPKTYFIKVFLNDKELNISEKDFKKGEDNYGKTG